MNEGNLFDMIDGCASPRSGNSVAEFADLREAFNANKSISCLPQDLTDMLESPPNDTTMAICMTIEGGRFSFLSSDEQEDFWRLIREGRRKMLEYYAKDKNINTILQACEPEF